VANYNRVFLLGNLTAEPESRELPTSGIVTDIRLAVNRSYRNRQGEPVEEVSYVDCTAYARNAEIARDYLRKGAPVFVEGRLHQDRWETEGGDKRSKLKVVIERLVLMPRPAAAGEGGGQRAGAPEVAANDVPYEEPPASEF
jgi:single-strand DNA-binding protein